MQNVAEFKAMWIMMLLHRIKQETVIQNMNCSDMKVTEAIGTGGH